MRGRTHGGKGSTARPTDTQKFNDSFDRIFGKKSGAGITEDNKHGDDTGSKSKKESGGATKSS